MKRAIVVVIIAAAAFAGGALWMKQRQAAPAAEHPPAAPAPAEKEAAGPQVSRDTNGNVVITMSEKTRKGPRHRGAKPNRVPDEPGAKGLRTGVGPRAAGGADDRTGHRPGRLHRFQQRTGPPQEFWKRKAMPRCAPSRRRRPRPCATALAVRSVREQVALSWGKAVARPARPAGFARSLASLEAALVRIDLPVGKTLPGPPAGARIATLSGQSAEAEFLGPATERGPANARPGLLFLLKPNSLPPHSRRIGCRLSQVPGEPLAGVIIPREAVVRAEGAGWVYVLNAAGDAFTRVEVAWTIPPKLAGS